MKKLFALVLALVMLLSLTACGGNEGKAAEEKAAEASEEVRPEAPEIEAGTPPVPAVDPVQFQKEQQEFFALEPEFLIKNVLVKAGDVPSDIEILDLMRNFKYQDIAFEGSSYKLNYAQHLDTALMMLKDSGAVMPTPQMIFDNFINDPCPQLRAYAVSLADNASRYQLELDESYAEAIYDLMMAEQDPGVLVTALSSIKYCIHDFPDLMKAVIYLASSDYPAVRREAANTISFNTDADGTKEVIISLMDDPEPGVRGQAAACAGKYHDESVLPRMKSMLEEANIDDLHHNVLLGLEIMWYNFPFYTDCSEEAYRIQTDYLKNTPPADKLPDAAAFKAFRTGVDDDWLKNNAGWFGQEELDELASILQALAENPDYATAYKIAAEDTLKKLAEIQLPEAPAE